MRATRLVVLGLLYILLPAIAAAQETSPAPERTAPADQNRKPIRRAPVKLRSDIEVQPNSDGTWDKVEVLPGGGVRLKDGKVITREEYEKARMEREPRYDSKDRPAPIIGTSPEARRTDANHRQPEAPHGLTTIQMLGAAGGVVIVVGCIVFFLRAHRKS
jgi:hypothetical protein